MTTSQDEVEGGSKVGPVKQPNIVFGGNDRATAQKNTQDCEECRETHALGLGAVGSNNKLLALRTERHESPRKSFESTKKQIDDRMCMTMGLNGCGCEGYV